MAGIPISGLPPVVSSLLTDEFPVVQAGVTSKATLAQVQTLFGFPSGIVPLSQGGTSAALTASNGGVVVSTASALTILSTLANGALVTDGSGIPSISLTLPLPVQSNITELGAQSQALNMNNHQINNVTDPTASKDAVNLEYLSSQLGFYLPLSGGTMSGLINMGSNKITALATPTVSTDAANKAYVDTVATGFNVQPACYAATTANLAGYIYNNGSSGVGATLTAGANGAFTTDGTTPPTNARILVWVQTTTFQNGIFVLSQTGDATHPAILTRSTDYNQPAQIQPGDLVVINNGTTYGGTSFIETASVTAVGTDPILFSQFTFSASQVLLKANNLSDVANKTTSFNNISPLTTQGDLITRDTTNNIRLASVNSASLVTSLTGVPTWLGPMTNGQVIIGSTGAIPVRAALTAGAGITVTNGAGSISIAATAAATAFTTIVIQTFTATGTYTPTSGMKYCIIEAIGGGGAGGGTGTTTATTFAAGGGGSSGSYSKGVFTAATIGVSQPVTIGAGGNGVAGGSGGNGGVTSVDALITAPGGNGGVIGGVTTLTIFEPGAPPGAVGSGGSLNLRGNPGGPSMASTVDAISGFGASSVIGTGSGSVTAAGSAIGGTTAQANGGGGGSGSASHTVAIAGTSGGGGGNGIVIITEFI